MPPRIAILVPVRDGSTRLRNKGLVKLCGVPSIKWTLGACAATDLPVYLCTDSAKIINATADMPLAGRVLVNGEPIKTGTDRCSYAVRANTSTFAEFSHFVIVAGDEPCAHPDDIKKLADNAGPRISTLVTQQGTQDAVTTCYVSVRGELDGFQRHDVPGQGERAPYVATGIYCYPRTLLIGYSMCPQSPAEKQTGIELQRWFGWGHTVDAVEADKHAGVGLNTHADIAKCETALRKLYQLDT